MTEKLPINLEYEPDNFLEQVIYDGFKFNYHQQTTNQFYYKCNKYKKLKCPASIVYDKMKGKYYHYNNHNHSVEPARLGEKRKIEIEDYIYNHPEEKRTKVIQKNLNKELSKDEFFD